MLCRLEKRRDDNGQTLYVEEETGKFYTLQDVMSDETILRDTETEGLLVGYAVEVVGDRGTYLVLSDRQW